MIRTAVAHLRAQWMGALALFLVLTGGIAYAADTIGSSDIINGQVKSVDIGNNQVQSVDVRDDTLSNGGLVGADIKEDTLAKVPDADALDGLSSAAFKVGCPSGWKTVAGLCFEDPDVGGYTLPEAVDRCTQLGGRLPTYTETVALAKSGISLSSSLLGDWTASSVDNDQTIYIDNAANTDNMDGVTSNTNEGYVRCVKTPVNALGFP